LFGNSRGNEKKRRVGSPMQRLQKLFVIFCISVLIGGFGLSLASEGAYAAPAAPSLTIQAESAILMDADTGQILFELNKDELRHPASMVKMMTEYLVMEAIENGAISWDTTVIVSKYADAIGGSGALIAEGHKYSVEDLFKQMSIYSSNDATVALAETVAGSEEAFVHMMNDKAREFGLSEGAIFTNATGLNKEDTGEYSPNIPGESMFTAHDAAIIAQRIIKDHPQILEFTKIPSAPAWENGPIMLNWNRILEGWKDYDNLFSAGAYEGLDGLKTGHTDEAGWCFTGTAQRGNIRLISVVMGTESEQARFNETKKLMDYGFNNFERKTILSPKTQIDVMPAIPVPKGKQKQVRVVTGSGVEYLVLKGTSDDAFKLTAEPVAEKDRTAPIESGQVLGKATITYEGPAIGIPETTTIDLVAAEDMEKAGWFTLLMRAIGAFFRDLFSSVKNLF
jgi:D-alanyl-D-alanine carboxypeptidase (penicillin-binding protein 5/6)